MGETTACLYGDGNDAIERKLGMWKTGRFGALFLSWRYTESGAQVDCL